MSIRHKLANVLVAGAVVIGGSLVSASPAAAAFPTCTTTEFRYSMMNGGFAVLPATSGGDSRCNLRQGNHNWAVGLLQNALNRCGRVAHNLEVDDDYGPLTREAVRKEQAWFAARGWGNTVDGIYGPIFDRDMFYWPSEATAEGPCKVTPVPAGNPVENLKPLP